MKQIVVARSDANGATIDPTKAPSDMQSVAKFLVNKTNLKVHEGVFHGVRVDYFKGKRAVDALLKEKYAASIKQPEVTSRESAVRLLTSLMESHNFFFRVDKQPQRVLELARKQVFAEDDEAYYVWQWQSPWARAKSMLFSVGLIAVVLIGVMFPLWPTSLRIGVWYVSMGGVGLIGLLLVLAIVRLIGYACSLMVPAARPGIWLFPNLFADVGVVDSFIPVWGWHGVDYESAHRARYLREKQGGGSKKKKSGKSKAVSADESSANSTAASTPLLVPANKGKGKAAAKPRNDEESDDEIAEEMEADEKPRKQD